MWDHLHHLFAVPTLDAHFWSALAGIIWIDLLLSGDNALVIAMVCNQLPERQRRIGMVLGAGAAVGLRVVFAVLIAELMGVGGLSLLGGLFLLYIASKMLLDDGAHGEHKPAMSLGGAIATIAIADAGMSLDNVMAIAGLSRGSDGAAWLMAFGVLLSIPLVIGGAALISTLLKRFPALIWAGAALLGWVAGGIIAEDPYVVAFLKADPHALHHALAVVGLLYVVTMGWAARRSEASVA
ncbi:YjbE family putative metal transport protein [Methylorubrum populi]|uniref:Integral membrane protein TerC n=1 Tax=Methylorubrum populi TaxID=223967 RepID=A0A833JAL9_9HYPH|nr:YjbE family putative metal transport protein [Methylorubrum populi]KAB7788074.1 hypothetical protein F8B43_0079 [Methylorubrum populi]